MGKDYVTDHKHHDSGCAMPSCLDSCHQYCTQSFPSFLLSQFIILDFHLQWQLTIAVTMRANLPNAHKDNNKKLKGGSNPLLLYSKVKKKKCLGFRCTLICHANIFKAKCTTILKCLYSDALTYDLMSPRSFTYSKWKNICNNLM